MEIKNLTWEIFVNIDLSSSGYKRKLKTWKSVLCIKTDGQLLCKLGRITMFHKLNTTTTYKYELDLERKACCKLIISLALIQ